MKKRIFAICCIVVVLVMFTISSFAFGNDDNSYTYGESKSIVPYEDITFRWNDPIQGLQIVSIPFPNMPNDTAGAETKIQLPLNELTNKTIWAENGTSILSFSTYKLEPIVFEDKSSLNNPFSDILVPPYGDKITVNLPKNGIYFFNNETHNGNTVKIKTYLTNIEFRIFAPVYAENSSEVTYHWGLYVTHEGQDRIKIIDTRTDYIRGEYSILFFDHGMVNYEAFINSFQWKYPSASGNDTETSIEKATQHIRFHEAGIITPEYGSEAPQLDNLDVLKNYITYKTLYEFSYHPASEYITNTVKPLEITYTYDGYDVNINIPFKHFQHLEGSDSIEINVSPLTITPEIYQTMMMFPFSFEVFGNSIINDTIYHRPSPYVSCKLYMSNHLEWLNTFHNEDTGETQTYYIERGTYTLVKTISENCYGKLFLPSNYQASEYKIAYDEIASKYYGEDRYVNKTLIASTQDCESIQINNMKFYKSFSANPQTTSNIIVRITQNIGSIKDSNWIETNITNNIFNRGILTNRDGWNIKPPEPWSFAGFLDGTISFFTTPIFGAFSISDLIIVVVGIGVLFAALKYFAGG